uniref:DDE-1 domain-containing protein n=1 Tax=Oryzias sinensis TaxID=183150 RepID=A0A8C7WWU1_9TELE
MGIWLYLLASGNEPKRQKKVLTLTLYAAVGRHYGLNESTVRYIKRNEKEIRSKPQPGPSTATDADEFRASKGWFDRFVRRYQIRSAIFHGEAASADTDAAANYPETFKQLIMENGYKPEQVLNMDETDEMKAPGFKAQKDRFTLMCGNTAGWMMKPGLIYKSANPRALKNKNKNTLPVFWMHNSKAWIMKVLTSNWFNQSFIHQALEYLSEKGMAFQELLLMDNAGGYTVDLRHEGVRIEFLPPNTKSLLQPMDQGVIRAFKALYTSNCLQQLVNAIDGDENFQLKVYWRNFTIASCLTVIHKVLQDMKEETLDACWKKIWPECVRDYKGFSPNEVQCDAVNKSVKLAQLIGGDGFDDVTHEEINELVDAHSQPPTDQDLAELTQSASENGIEDQEDPSQEDVEDEGLTLERLVDLMQAAAGER